MTLIDFCDIVKAIFCPISLPPTSCHVYIHTWHSSTPSRLIFLLTSPFLLHDLISLGSLVSSSCEPSYRFFICVCAELHDNTKINFWYCDPKGFIWFRHALGVISCFRSQDGTSFMNSTVFAFSCGSDSPHGVHLFVLDFREYVEKTF